MGILGIKTLVVEDNLPDFKWVKQMLNLNEFDLYNTTTLDETTNWLRYNNPDVILLDLNLPDSRGINTFETLRKAQEQTAIIVLTGMDDTELGLKAVRMGAQDYLNKDGLTPVLLEKSIRFSIERNRLQQWLLQTLVIEIKGEDKKRLLPACSSCGNVRDPFDAVWKPIVNYLEERGRLFMTHGLCPNCLRIHYAEVLDEAHEAKKIRDSDE